MAENPLLKKLRLLEGKKALILNAPDGFIESLKPYPQGTTIHSAAAKKAEYDLVLLFVLNSGELNEFGDLAITALKKNGILWFAYPKQSSGIKSDLTRDEGWSFLDPYSLAGVSSIAIDNSWSGIRFKHAADGISHGQRMAEFKAKQKEPKDRTIVVPADFQAALSSNPKALEVFEKFAYTHRKEYVQWIESAKKQETRDNRITKAIERITEGTKFS